MHCLSRCTRNLRASFQCTQNFFFAALSDPRHTGLVKSTRHSRYKAARYVQSKAYKAKIDSLR
jgi:hypothetical protein